MTRLARRLIVGMAGGAIVALGLVMTVAPGPGLLLIPAGLGVLALEFDSAQRLQRRIGDAVARLRARWRTRRRGDGETP